MSSQNRISLQLSEAQLAAAREAIGSLEQALASLVSLSPPERRRLIKMGPKSESFCRQALRVMEQNPHIVPDSVDVASAREDLVALDALRPLLDRVRRLAERGNDTEMALGSDVMDVSLKGYQLLRVAGKQQGLDGFAKELGLRWAKSRRKQEEAEPAEDPA